MKRESYRERAVVIRSYDFGEADRIIVFLTKNRGLIRGVAKGARRAKSRFGSRLQPFVELDVQLYAGRSLESITGADTVQFFGTGIIENLERYSAASAVVEAAERLMQSTGYGEPELYTLVVDTLAELQTVVEPTLRLDAFLLQAMDLAGWAPSLFYCAQCQAPGPHHVFHPAPGGAVCVHCRPVGSTEVDEEVLHIMWLLLEDHYQQATKLVAGHVDAVHRLTKSHFHWHVERKLASLNVLDQA